MRMTKTMIPRTTIMLLHFSLMVMVCIKICVHSISIFSYVHSNSICCLDIS
jgi:hypothetical protein